MTIKGIKARFNSKLELYDNGCWRWLAAHNNRGYGVFSYQGKPMLAHRVSWIINNGPIPSGFNVLHKCDNPECVNPKHLFLGSLSDNMRDCARKGRLHVNFPGYKGEKHRSSKLTNNDVLNIIESRSAGVPGQELADKYGVCRQTIYDIAGGRAWKHMQGRII